MSTSSFLNTVTDFKERTNQVKIAVTLSRSNHIVQSTIRAIFSQLQQQGLTIIGSVDKNDALEIFMPIIRDIINSLITVGYFAVVIDKNNKPKIIDPELYIVVPPTFFAFSNSGKKSDLDHNIVFLRQADCDTYRDNCPTLFLQYPPTECGILTCPLMSVVDMHDAIIEFIRLAILSDSINLRPKAWVSSKEVTKNPGVYHFLEPNEALDDISQRRIKKNRENAEKYIEAKNANKRINSADGSSTRTFADTCISRKTIFDSANDPSIMVEVMPNMEITEMGQTKTRTDLVHLIELFDQRMCNALGIPTMLLGIQKSGHGASENSNHVMRLWETILVPYRFYLNNGLALIVEETILKKNLVQFKKTRNREFLNITRISFESSISFETLISLQPFLTASAFADLMAKQTGLKKKDFRQDDPAKEKD